MTQKRSLISTRRCTVAASASVSNSMVSAISVRPRDIASARLFYERAADAGNGRAALRMGESFDRAFLDSIGIYRMIGDRQLALSWYRRARDLGDTEAARLLHKL